MKLRDKLKSFAMDNHIEEYAELNVKNLEKIAEEFAIDFFDWIKDKGFSSVYYNNKKISTKEILEIFKKEKGL